ncbi:calcium-dependent phosphotriesterase [Neoconidiobolus thromboides FSU 785]|nr:calcium-dependent phosphotriesterase [Neoconidiobolus thromboides FSU 785]
MYSFKSLFLLLPTLLNANRLLNSLNLNGQSFDLTAKPYLTSETSPFGPYIEGTGVSPDGTLYAVDYGSNTTLHQLGSITHSSLFYAHNDSNSWFNSIRFLSGTELVTGDVRLHSILKLKLANNDIDKIESSILCQDDELLQPNDLAITNNGKFIYTSGMKFVKDNKIGDGDVWVCDSNVGSFKRLLKLGRTNGIEVSPDDRYLYVSESFNKGGAPSSQVIWKYTIDGTNGELSEKEKFIDFQEVDGSVEYDIDGMRTDIEGNLFVTRHGQGKVMVFDKEGNVLGQVRLNIIKPTNLEFGGDKGDTLYIVGQCPEYHKTEGVGKGCVDRIKLEVMGRAFFNLNVKRESDY